MSAAKLTENFDKIIRICKTNESWQDKGKGIAKGTIPKEISLNNDISTFQGDVKRNSTSVYSTANGRLSLDSADGVEKHSDIDAWNQLLQRLRSLETTLKFLNSIMRYFLEITHSALGHVKTSPCHSFMSSGK